MENNYQIIKRPRTAKLVELVGENFEPFYKFKETSIDFRNAPKDAGSELIYLTHSNKVDKKDVKNIAIKTFEEDYSGELFIKNQTLFNPHPRNSIEDWNQLKSRTEELLENTKFRNFYNVFSKKFWKAGFSTGFAKTCLEVTGIGGIGTEFYDLIAKSSDISGETALALGILAFGVGEFARRAAKSKLTKDLNSTNQNIEYYDNFRRNIEKSDVTIIAPVEAKQIYQDLKNSQVQGKFVRVDFDAANKELINTYQKF